MGLTGLKSRGRERCVPSEALEEDPFPRLFLRPEGLHSPWLVVPFPLLQSSNVASL